MDPARRRRMEILVLLGAFAAMGPVAIDMYVPALPAIARDLDVSTASTQLTLTTFLIGLGVGQVVSGPFSDVLGRRRPLLIGTAVYAAAAVTCALAQSVDVLAGARFAQGFSAAAGVVISRAIVRDLYTGPALARSYSRLYLVIGAAPIAAPVIGTQVLRFTSWRGIFATGSSSPTRQRSRCATKQLSRAPPRRSSGSSSTARAPSRRPSPESRAAEASYRLGSWSRASPLQAAPALSLRSEASEVAALAKPCSSATERRSRCASEFWGTGMAGKTIATKLVQLGHEVSMGARDARNEKATSWADTAGAGASRGAFADATGFGEVVFNCPAGAASLDALTLAGEDVLAGKILVDVANPLDFSQGMPPTLTVCNTDRLGEQIQRAYPTTRVAKALNTMNCQVMVDPELVPGEHNVFVCGNTRRRKDEVAGLLTCFGWPRERILDLGDISPARGTEMYLPLWLRLRGAIGTGHLNIQVCR